jgi:hypothetical protein
MALHKHGILNFGFDLQNSLCGNYFYHYYYVSARAVRLVTIARGFLVGAKMNACFSPSQEKAKRSLTKDHISCARDIMENSAYEMLLNISQLWCVGSVQSVCFRKNSFRIFSVLILTK